MSWSNLYQNLVKRKVALFLHFRHKDPGPNTILSVLNGLLTNLMNPPDLHIVAFAVPYPPVYGGAIDVLNRIRALHQEGVSIHLHCFVYGNFGPHDVLKELTKEVHYYPRITWPALLAPGLPYIVSSRRNPLLLERLKGDNIPVLFEGIHTTGFVEELNKKMLLRSHNIEHQYYGHLAKNSQRFQYLFFQRESLALQRYECNHCTSFDTVFAISEKDKTWYDQKGSKCEFMPAYHGIEEVEIKEGRGEYLLYQGDLSIEINQKAVLDMLKTLSEGPAYPVVIAGKSGDPSFEEKLTKYPNLKREVDVSGDRMTSLISDAQIVIIHSRNPSGMKVKIFPALYYGRHVLASENNVTYTALDDAMHLYKNPEEMKAMIEMLWLTPVTTGIIEQRKALTGSLPSDREKARQIIKHL